MPGLPPRLELARDLVLGRTAGRLLDPLARSLGGSGYASAVSRSRGCLVVIGSPPGP